MMRQTIAGVTAVVLVLLGALLSPGSPLNPSEVNAQVMTDYTAQPPFLSNATFPNILFIADSTSTMQKREYGLVSFVATTKFSGLLDPMRCYADDPGDTRFEPSGAAKAAINTACASTLWDGNFLNWAALRRADSVKKAMTGGSCVKIGGGAARDADGNCIPSGTPAMPTISHMTQSETKHPAAVSSATYTGRIPSTVPPVGNPNLIFHVQSDGILCVGTSSSCLSSDPKFKLYVALESQPSGVLQDFAGKARFGLLRFSGGGQTPDIEVLVPVGGRQSRDYLGTGIETFNTNTDAMLDAVDEIFQKSGTPLEEALYEAVRYFAQLDSVFNTSTYVFPLAYSPAVALAATGKGSMGSGEITALTGSETCPSGYITNACGRDPYFFGSNHTPAWASPSGQAACCKSYIIVFSDGQANGSAAAKPAGLQSIAAYNPYRGTACSGSNSADPPSPLTTCSDALTLSAEEVLSQHRAPGKHIMDEIAYWAHTNDMRQATIPVINEAGKDLSGFQNITFYAYQTAADPEGRDYLLHMAMAGGFEDANGNNLPDNGLAGASAAPCSTTDLTQPCEWDKINNSTGALGRDNVPDTFFQAENVDEMAAKMTAALSSILQRSSAGSAVSVLASSSSGEGAAYQAFFYPRFAEGFKSIEWIGFLQGLFIDALGNLREDTNGDGKLIYADDRIIRTRYDTATSMVLVDKFVDSNSDGEADSSTCEQCGKELKDIKPIWEAGKQLALMDSTSRKILTWVDSDNDGLVDSGEQMAFTTANSATLGPYLRAGAAPYTADNIINFIRGDQVTGLRDRQLTVNGSTKVWKLGDIVDSTPTMVGPPRERYDVIYGDSTYTSFFTKYKNRHMVAYAGANDGMLHAFNAGFYHRGDDPNTSAATEHGWFTRTATDNSAGPLLGDELWGFIPYHLLPQLLWLTRGDYGHTYYVDLKPKVTDVRIFTPDTDHPEGWGTILIGGFRLGGSCQVCPAGNGKVMSVNISGTPRVFYSAYFVLDITNPEVDPKLLWSFTDDRLGLTTSYPAVLRVSPLADAKTSNTNAKWFAFFGSGPTEYTGASSVAGQVYIVDLKLGPGAANGNVTQESIDKDAVNSFVGDIISLDANLDYRADVTYFGSVIDTGSTPKWAGRLFRLTTSASGAPPFGGSTWPGNWGAQNKPTWFLHDFGCTPSPSCAGPKKSGPILAAPTVTMDDSLNVWVFVGTGRLLHKDDQGNTETQYFFGMKDDTINGTCTQGSDKDCQQKDLVNVSAAVVCSTCAGGTNQVTDPNNTGVTTLTGTATSTLQGLVASKEGWYTTLPTSKERVLVSPTLIGGTVLFPSYVPEGEVCVSGTGSSTLYALFYLTGSAYKVSVVGTDTVGGNTNVKRSTALGAGMASQIGIHIGAQGTDSATGVTSRSKACSQLSTGALTCIQTAPALSTWSRYLSWINLRL